MTRSTLALALLCACAPPDPAEVAAHLYDPDHVVQVELEIDPADAEQLGSEQTSFFELLYGADCLSEPLGADYTWFAAAVTVDRVELPRTGVRKKGLLGSLSSSKPSLKLKFDKFHEGQLLGDIERMTLNNSVADPTLMRQCLGYALFADAGLASPRCNFAHVTGNGEDLGTYVHLESVKKRFLEASFGDPDGDLYEGGVSDFRDGWLGTFEADTDETDPDHGPLIALTDALQAPEDQLIDAVAAVLDLDAFLEFWAMEVLVSHVDGHAGNTNNFYVYRSPADDRLHFIPWGIDAIFLEPMQIWDQDTEAAVLANGALTHALWAHPEGRARYEATLRRLLDEVWHEGKLHREIDRMSALIGPEATEIGQLRAFVDTRRATLLAALDGPDPALPELREIPCYVPSGALSATFDTTWGTLDQDPLSTGNSTAIGALDETEIDLRGGAVSGLDGDRATLILGAQYEAERVLIAVTLPRESITPGTIEIDGVTVVSELLAGPLGEESQVAIAAPGTLGFTAAKRKAGQPIRGELQVELLLGGL